MQIYQSKISENKANNIYSKRVFVIPEDYGAKANGVNDDSSAIQLALNSGFPVKLSPKTYFLGSPIVMNSKNSLSGFGEKSLLKTNGDHNAINVVGVDVSIFDLGLFGPGKTSGLVNSNAIFLEGNAPTTIRTTLMLSNLFISDFGNAGFLQIGRTSLTYQSSAIVSNVTISRCKIGFDMQVRAEYNSFSNIVAHENDVGVRMQGGNNSFIGGQITSNIDGVVLGAGSNDGHSVMTGTMINHNTCAIKSNGIIFGYLFNACMFYEGFIEIIDSSKIKFSNCDLELTEIRTAKATNLEFNSNKFIITPVFIDNYLGLGVSSIKFYNDNFITGSIPSFIRSYINGKFNIEDTPIYIDNSDAIANGLNVGDVYKKSTGTLMVVY